MCIALFVTHSSVVIAAQQDRYREFMTAAREFSFMRATKRFGVEPSPELPLGSMAVLCPACPQPGINMDPKYEHVGRPKGEE